jgi:hypothetical protein
VPKKRKPGQRKLNADTNDQESALAALAGMGIADAILPAVSIPVETSNAVLEALDSKLSWATAREEGVKANEFWTAETARVRDENRNVFLNLDDAKRACAIHLMVVATGGDAPAEALICFVGWADTNVQAEIQTIASKVRVLETGRAWVLNFSGQTASLHQQRETTCKTKSEPFPG